MASASDAPRTSRWPMFFRMASSDRGSVGEKDGPAKWNMGILNDRQTVEVPGSVLLLASDRNEPLGLRNAPARTSHSSIPTGILRDAQPQAEDPKKRTRDGKIILEPQPEESENDPLNWPAWRRDSALLSLGLLCMVGGGLTPILAAGFTDVARDYDVDVHEVSLTTGLYMMGMGVGSVIFSPTAILWGKRPVYLFGAVMLIACSAWCAASPSFTSLLVARVFQGIAVSPVECLPSATIAEIFFLHERAFRIGIYTLLLLGGKNLVPLVSAAVIQNLGWRWVFWIVAFVVAFCGTLLFFFVPETFWDRAPVPKSRKSSAARPNIFRRYSSKHNVPHQLAHPASAGHQLEHAPTPRLSTDVAAAESARHRTRNVHVGFAPGFEPERTSPLPHVQLTEPKPPLPAVPRPESPLPLAPRPHVGFAATEEEGVDDSERSPPNEPDHPSPEVLAEKLTAIPPNPALRGLQPVHHEAAKDSESHPAHAGETRAAKPDLGKDTDSERQTPSIRSLMPGGHGYTRALRDMPARSFVQQLKPFHGRLNQDKWLKVVVRPLILYSYPSVLWSAGVYACSVGWLIVISESVAVIYRNKDSYNFNAFQTGLVYLSPFIGGILGTAVAGKVSDVIVKAMAARNGGLYEPEFRLVMAVPIALTTIIGLMGFGWSAENKDAWIVPTVFFGIVSFGCSLGSTTAITFCVDSYRQYAGEALVTLNFTKNVFHGLVFSLFVTGWINQDGPKTVYIWIGVIQLILLLFTIPMYIYGKRARMWTVRKNFMEKF